MTYKLSSIIISLIITLLLHACKRVTYYQDKPITCDKTLFLAHHGAGDKYEANSLRATKYGIDSCDGIECDIQLGKDGTLWLDHSSTIEGCGIITTSRYIDLSDNQIKYLDSCAGDRFNTFPLDSVFEYIAKHGGNKFISLDVKAWDTKGLENISLFEQLKKLAQTIIYLTNKYNLNGHVMVESETGDFLYYIHKNTNGIETYLTTLGDFELGVSRAIHANFTGISFKYNFIEKIDQEDIALIHRKGLKIHLWTINDSQLIDEAALLKPDYIQTDNVDYARNFK